MSIVQIKEKLIETNKRFEKLFDYLSETSASNLTLTSVVLIIGIVKIENLTNTKVDLTSWLS